ncbi:MAG: HD-GYP domain-containing protein [Lachnospiraceae bacterium]|nr:HD-GYP domain-containing protein [Lachnospiraceae bacterium]
MLVVSQFTGLYYTFDENNNYVRARFFLISYFFPTIVMFIQFMVLFQYRKSLRKLIRYPLMLFAIVPIIASILQIFTYGVSLINMSIVGMAVLLFVFALIDMNTSVKQAHRIEIDYLKRQQKSMRHLFEQTATALANAIDAKDKYTHGHSSRVAEYSRRIAELSGKSEEECDEVYFSALLHDVGKIGVPDRIINKEGKLTDEEFEAIKKHPEIGNNILSSISEYPYLSIGAHHHHERYDGKGYPDRLKGEDIPEIARIVAVADAYDAMTSRRSYRDSIPQSKVREEIIKGAGNQFDPVFANIMQHLIDLDQEYELRERGTGKFGDDDALYCIDYKDTVSDGVLVTPNKVKISLRFTPDEDNRYEGMAALLLFDSNDGRAYSEERKQKELHYFEYGEIMFDGRTTIAGARGMQTKTTRSEEKPEKKISGEKKDYTEYLIEAVRFRDHALVRIEGDGKVLEITIALPDSSRFLYLGLTGRYCSISDVRIEKSEEEIGEGYIQRIAEEISYINVPEGDVPNVQIDGYRTDATVGIPITGRLKLSFHSMSLPTANLIWHCPFITIFNSLDGKVRDEGCREFALIRIDGEYWEPDEAGKNEIFVNKRDDFEGWDSWKQKNKDGIDCTVTFTRKGNTITTITENMGIYVKNVTTITDDTEDIYAALTGDQVALTDIRIDTK